MNPVAGENLAYTIHFYAASHGQDLRNKVAGALSRGVAVFATEWGTCEASGNGALNLGETNAWMDFLAQNHISDANWAISDKAETCSALHPGASKTGGWPTHQLSPSGTFLRSSIQNFAKTAIRLPQLRNPTDDDCATKRPKCSGLGKDCRNTKCCIDPGMQCFQKNPYWANCNKTCKPGIDPYEPKKYQTPWSCTPLGPRTPESTGSGLFPYWPVHWTGFPNFPSLPIFPGWSSPTASENDETVLRVNVLKAPPSMEKKGTKVTVGMGKEKLQGEILGTSTDAPVFFEVFMFITAVAAVVMVGVWQRRVSWEAGWKAGWKAGNEAAINSSNGPRNSFGDALRNLFPSALPPPPPADPPPTRPQPIPFNTPPRRWQTPSIFGSDKQPSSSLSPRSRWRFPLFCGGGGKGV